MNKKEVDLKSKEANSSTILQILKYATAWDYVLIVIGIAGSLIAGVNWPILNILFGGVVDVFVDFEDDLANATAQGEDHDDLISDFMSQIYMYTGFTFALCILFTVGNFMTLYAFQLFAMRMVKRVKEAYFRSILTQEVAWFDRQNSGEFASRISSDFKKFENAINENFGLLLYNVSAALFNLGIGFFYGWKLSLVILSLSPISICGSFFVTKFQTYFMQKELNAYSVASSAAEEAISAIRTVFAFGGQQREQKRYEATLNPAMIYGCKRNFVTGIGNSVTWGSIYFAFALGIWYGVKLIIDPEESYTIGLVVTVFWCVTSCGYNIGYAAPYFESFQIGLTATKSLVEVMERRSAIDSSSTVGIKLKPGHNTNIEFRQVHFSYPTRSDIPILKGLNLKINSGEIVALVGPSGCGKSTTIQLIQRFYDPDSGEIYLDGVNIAQLNIGWLRAQLGVVGQEPVLFDASIEDNIRMGMPNYLMSKVTQQEIERAASEANAHEFISKLPDGYKTHVGDRGTQLSGGQKQRIAIARALIAKPKILLLDEATSALDLESEHVVQTALDRASKGRTTIIIAHRLSTIINADRIIFIEDGQVKEMGTHQELMSKKKHYHALVMAQQVDNPSEDYLPKPENSLPLMRHSSTIRSDTSSMIIGDKYDEIEPEQLKIIEKTQFPYRRIVNLIWDDKCYFMIAFVAALIFGMATPFYAMIFGEFVNMFSKTKDNDEIMENSYIYSILFLVLSAGIFIFCTMQITLFGIVGEKLTKKLRMMAYTAILNQEIAWFDEKENSAGALCARLANDAANVQGATGLRVSMMCQAISTLVVSLVMGFSYNWRLSLVSMALMPIVAGATMLSASIYTAQAVTDSDAVQKSSKLLIEVMNAVRTVVSLHKEEYFYNRFTETLFQHLQGIH